MISNPAKQGARLRTTQERDESGEQRRVFLRRCGTFGAGLGIAMTCAGSAVAASAGERRIAFTNIHTGERFDDVYRVGDHYLPGAIAKINHVLRDHRNDKVFPMAPGVIDLIYMIRRKAGVNHDFDIISGYRSPETNRMLRRASTGVAKNSLHMSGQAIDLKLPGLDLYDLRKIAIDLHVGGVGYYPDSGFVHVDIGEVRTW